MTDMGMILKEIAGKMRYVQAPPPTPYKTYCKPDCPICHGALWIRRDLPIDHPNFGKLVPCPNADLLSLYTSTSGLDDKDREMSWNSIQDRDETNVMEAMEAVLYTLQKGYGWVFLHGGYGLAKTLLLKVATVESLKNGKEASYRRMAEVIEHMRQAYDDKARGQEEAEARLDRWAGLPVLCLDEFDRVRSTEFATEKRFVLMDRRYEDAIKGKSVTLIASNASPKDFEGYLSSRIRDIHFQVIEMTGKDFRQYTG